MFPLFRSRTRCKKIKIITVAYSVTFVDKDLSFLSHTHTKLSSLDLVMLVQ